MADELLKQLTTVLGGASIYGAGNYGAGVYGSDALNYVVFQPLPFGVVWEPDSVIINTDSTSIPLFAAYIDVATPGNCVGSSYNGNQDSVDLPAIQLTANNLLICVWFGGDSGSNAMATLIGQSGQLEQ